MNRPVSVLVTAAFIFGIILGVCTLAIIQSWMQGDAGHLWHSIFHRVVCENGRCY